MPIGKIIKKKCPQCKKKFFFILGDVRPQRIVCPYCRCVWLYTKT